MQKFDVLVIGAGIIGLSIAWQLSRRSSQRIVVLEKGAGTGEGSTGASSAVCRFRYSQRQMVRLARDGINAYRNWQAFTGLARTRANFHQHGCLWLTGANHRWANEQHLRMQELGIATCVVDDDELVERFPALNPCTLAPDLEAGEEHACTGGGKQLLELEGGYIDPVAAADDLLEASRANGVQVRFRAPVTAIQSTGGRVTGVTLDSGELIEAPLVINASGPWCHDLFDAAGLEIKWNLVPTRIQVLYLDRPEELKGHIPVAVDMAGGIYFRTQNRGQQLVVSSVLEEDEREAVADPDSYRLEPDDDFIHNKLHLLHHRLPALPYRGKIRGYCGLYTVNRDDVHPIVGPTELEGFWVANGFSGHGFKLAPAIGSMISQAITGERLADDTDVPLDYLALDREPIPTQDKSVLA